MAFHWRRVADVTDDGRLLRDVLRGHVGISQRLLHALKFQGEISVNGAPVTVRAVIHAGDEITLHLPDELSGTQRVIPEPLPLTVVFEDEDLLVVEKPTRMIVHPVPPEPRGTLANAVAWHWQSAGLNQPVRVITRLDRDTSGLVLIAKNALAQHQYSEPRAIGKRYLALVHGQPPEAGGLIDMPIGINPSNPVTRQVDPAGKPAKTLWSRLHTWGEYSLVSAELLTGRTHQIRVHFAWLGHPLLGDRQYGGEQTLIDRQALHCRELSFRHLRSGLPLHFVSPLPEDMQTLCRGVELEKAENRGGACYLRGKGVQ